MNENVGSGVGVGLGVSDSLFGLVYSLESNGPE